MKIESVSMGRTSKILPDYLLIAFILLALLVSACGAPDQVAAVPRNSKFKPVFGEEKALPPKERRNHQFDLSFLNDDHFACIRIKPSSVLNNQDFKEIQWQDLEVQIAEVLGERNSQLSAMKAIWVILDQSIVSSMSSANGDLNSPFIWIVDYANPFDAEQLEEVKSNQDQSNLIVKSLSETRLAIGSEDALNKLEGPESATDLSDLVANWDTDSAAQGALTIGPIRTFLVSIFEMVSRFGPEAKKLANLPDVVEDIQLKVKLEQSRDGEHVLVEGHISISDDDLAKEIVKSLSGLSESSSSPMSSIINGGMGGMDRPGTMFEPTSVSAIDVLVKEIKDKELFSVQNEAGKIVFRLLRPDSLKKAIAASVADGRKQIEILARVEKLNRIAQALEAYEDKYDRLPSMNAVSKNESEKTGIPPQFSWRTAILPFLDQQELYDRFDFTKPWDAKENMDLAREIPDEFRIEDDNQTTALHLAAGADAVYRSDRPQPVLSDIKDKKIWTAIVIEASPRMAQDWTKPGILELDDGSTEDLGAGDENGVLLINAAFKTRAVKKDNELIRKVLTCAGDEKMTRLDFIPLEMSGRN